MSLHPKPIGPVPEETARIAHAVFPRGSTYLRLRDELGPIYDDEAFCALFPARGQPAEAPWRLALATTLQFAVVYWRSLRNALLVEEWLAGAIGALYGQQAVPSAGQMARLDLLLQLLQAQRCLLVLDNAETILERALARVTTVRVTPATGRSCGARAKRHTRAA